MNTLDVQLVVCGRIVFVLDALNCVRFVDSCNKITDAHGNLWQILFKVNTIIGILVRAEKITN